MGVCEAGEVGAAARDAAPRPHGGQVVILLVLVAEEMLQGVARAQLQLVVMPTRLVKLLFPSLKIRKRGCRVAQWVVRWPAV